MVFVKSESSKRSATTATGTDAPNFTGTGPAAVSSSTATATTASAAAKTATTSTTTATTTTTTTANGLKFTSSNTSAGAANLPKIDPFSHNHMGVPKKTFSGARMIGIGLFAVVFSVYGFTMHQLTQEDFSEITIPDSIKQQKKAEAAQQQQN